MYLPLFVGAEGKTDDAGRPVDIGFTKDNTGENISSLNSGFCELTGLYWAWKNLDADYIGLVHYRRHFSGKKGSGDAFDNILTEKDIEPYLGKVKIFVPKKRNYYIETLYSHYAHTHYETHLVETKAIISEKYPEYSDCLNDVLEWKKASMFNMMIMTKELLDEYCSWLFDILFELRKRVDASELSPYQQRFYGRISEILLNVWIKHKVEDGFLAADEVMELPWLQTEKVNWLKKGSAFLQAKFTNKKYEGSF